jgi:hypothetical protein
MIKSNAIESVEILNWKDVVSQFGLVVTTPGLLSAPELSKELRKKVLESDDSHIFIECNTKSEAVACFECRKRLGSSIWYEYIGTAN